MSARAISKRTGKPKRKYTVSEKVKRHTARKDLGQGMKPYELDMKVLETLCQLHVTKEEIAAAFQVSPAYITLRMAKDPEFKAIIERGMAGGKTSLRRKLWNMASVDSRAAIHLSKNILGYTDKVEVNQNQTVDVNVRIEGDKAMAQWIELMRRQLRNGPQPQIVEVQAQKAG
jgi:hypothetical protein